jgi:Na+-transporting methylmalonyl-CoA/oxaloacetate decarboxylase gamma subunit
LLYIFILLCVLRILGGLSSIFFDATAKEEGRQEIPASHREEEDAPVISRKTKTQKVARCDKIKIERRVRVEA